MSANRPPASFSFSRLLTNSLAYHWRMNLAVAVGVLAGAAVLTGALIVGDSVRGSLKHLALDGLGRIDRALVVDRFFRGQLAQEVEPLGKDGQIEPCILLPGTVSNPGSGKRANQVTLIGCEPTFFDLAATKARDDLSHAQQSWNSFSGTNVLVNRALAEALEIAAGAELLVRLPTPSEVPRDTPLGRKTETIATRRVTVAWIVPDDQMGRFALHPNQRSALNVFFPLNALQGALEQEEKINTLLVVDGNRSTAPPSAAEPGYAAGKRGKLAPRLIDYGLFVQRTPQGYGMLGSTRMMIDDDAYRAFEKLEGLQQRQPVLTYLANYIKCGASDRGKIAYSTITALDVGAASALPAFKTIDGKILEKIEDNSIVLNRWTFDDFAAQGVELKLGDEIRIEYFEPESTHGQTRESQATFKLQAVVEMDEATTDRNFTPELKGVTDEVSINDWNPPFPYEPKRVRSTKPNDQDEQYWNQYRAAPKAFVSLATGQKLWASRFGKATSIRFAPQDDQSDESIATKLEQQIDPAAMGFAFRPIRAQAEQAATGTTPFNLLFLGFSMFIIAAAVMLVALLFRLGIERRAREIGILLATGWSTKQVRRLLLAEGAFVAAAGGVAGVAAGVGYAWLMLAGLRTWWLAAITTPFLQLHVEPVTLPAGFVCGFFVSLAAIAWALWQMRRVSVRRLLAGETGEENGPTGRAGRASRWVAWGSFAGAAVASIAAFALSGEAQAGAFFGAGALILTALLAGLWRRLSNGRAGSLVTRGGGAIARLAVRNAARYPSRSTLTIGLMAAACFLIVAISAFHLDPPASPEQHDTGLGGFALLAESDAPLFLDLSSEDGRLDLGFSDKDETLLAGCELFPFRSQPGDDASCLNLYQPQQPRVLGATVRFIERGGFAWSATAADDDATRANPWLLLDRSAGQTEQGEAIVPVVIDAATAMFSLHLSGVGARYELTDGRGQKLTLQVVGLLKNSIFQGRLLVSEQSFLRHFPDAGGFRFFLIGTRPEQVATVETALETTLGTYGFDTVSSTQRLGEFLAVQNTYLSTFQSLGGLGLLLGTLGLATVQLRNVLERRGELALLRATGFRRALVARLVMWENVALLGGGLAVGCLAALVAILPHLLQGGAAIPWGTLGATLGLVLAVGFVAGLGAVRAVLNTPVLAALRGE